MKTKLPGKLSKSDLRTQLLWAEGELAECIERVQSLRDYITAVRKLSGKKGPPAEQRPLPGITMIRRRTKGAALAKQVAEVLKAAGHALHVKVIVQKLEASGNPVIAKNPTNTVAVALIRRADQFVKVSPNTFDLVNREGQAVESA